MLHLVTHFEIMVTACNKMTRLLLKSSLLEQDAAYPLSQASVTHLH